MLSGSIKQWIKDNPMDAECIEDLECWCCEEFEILDDETADEIFQYARDCHPCMDK
jgi:hypothetical protein